MVAGERVAVVVVVAGHLAHATALAHAQRREPVFARSERGFEMKCRYVRGMECECNGDCNNCDMAGTVERSIKRKDKDDAERKRKADKSN